MPTGMATTNPTTFRLPAGQLAVFFGRSDPQQRMWRLRRGRAEGAAAVGCPYAHLGTRLGARDGKDGNDEGWAMVLHFSRVSAMLIWFRLHPVRRVRTPCRRFVVGV